MRPYLKETTRPSRCPYGAKERLLAAGVRLFLAHPSSSISSRTIAGEAKVNHALISYHFGGMVQLMEAVVLRCLDTLQQHIQPVLSECAQKLHEGTQEQIDFIFSQGMLEVMLALQHERSATLLRALSSTQEHLTPNLYPRFTAMISEPLYELFVTYLVKVRGEAPQCVTVAILAQVLLAQCLAFFRGATLVKKQLAVEELTEKQHRQAIRLVIASMVHAAKA